MSIWLKIFVKKMLLLPPRPMAADLLKKLISKYKIIVIAGNARSKLKIIII